MKIISLIPGSPEWIKSRSSSKAPAMMGDSLYQTRSQLLHQMATGITKDVDAATQARFDNGHRTEKLSRALAAEIIGDDLAPISAASDDDYLSANFDGITFLSNIGYEHKDWNEKLAASVRNGVVPSSHAWQLDQQIYVGDLEYVLFVVSDGTKERFVSHKYYPNQTRIDMLLAGWKDFDTDLAAYVPPEVVPEVIAAPIKDLPAITYKMDGMHLSTNLRNDVKPAILALVEQSKRKLETDQDFADLDALCKKFKQAEEQCALVQSQAVGEIKDVDAFCRDLKELSEIMRQARISGEKAVTSEKEARKLKILSKAKADYVAHVVALEIEIKPILLFKGPMDMPDFAGAMKGLKKLSAMQEAVENALRDGKMLADSAAKDVRAKLAWCKEHAAGYGALFPDLQALMQKAMEDFMLIITSRIEAQKKADEAKLEAERQRIQSEEEAKARIKIEAEARTKAEEEARATAVFEAARIKADQDLMPTVPTMAEDRATMESQIEERRKQAQIAEQSKPFNGAPAKLIHPSDAEIIEAMQPAFAATSYEADVPAKRIRPDDGEVIAVIMDEFSVSYGQACDYIIAVAENLRASP